MARRSSGWLDSGLPGSAPLTDRRFNLWHGTDHQSALRLEAEGAAPTHSRRGLDFGAGFYTTSNRQQAEHWANIQAIGRKTGPATLVQFSVPYAELAELRQVSFIRFGRTALEFWAFVGKMRSGSFNCHFQGGYFDLICGPVSLKPGRFRVGPDSDQFSFHGPRGYEFINGCGKLLVVAHDKGRFGP